MPAHGGFAWSKLRRHSRSERCPVWTLGSQCRREPKLDCRLGSFVMCGNNRSIVVTGISVAYCSCGVIVTLSVINDLFIIEPRVGFLAV